METTRPHPRVHLRPGRGIGPLGALCVLAILAAPSHLGAQSPVGPRAPTAAPDSAAALDRGISPRGAFVRAVFVPGWGHASIGSYKRAAFYFVTEGATAWNLVKTRRRYAEAQERVQFRDRILRADLADQGVTDPEAIQTALDDDEDLQDLLGLEEARRQQREDWTALGIFLMFLSGADAYVSAHLKDFPAPVSLNAQPVGGGRMDLSLGFKLPR